MDFFILSLVALFIGVSKAGFGGGTGLLVGPLLALLYPSAKDSIGLMLPMLLACDVISLYPYWGKWDRFNVMIITPGAVVGIIAGSFALGVMSDEILKKTIGGLAIAFALLQIYRDWIVRSEKGLVPDRFVGTVVGVGTGFVSTLSHVGGTLTTMYLIPQRMDAERFVGTTTAIYFLVNVFKLPPYVWHGLVTADNLWTGLTMVPVLAIGTALGVYLNRRVPSAWFSRVVLVVVLITGVTLLIG